MPAKGGMSKYLVMFKVNIWFSLLDIPTLGKYYNDNVILLQSLRILQKDQMLKLLISNMQSVCFVNNTRITILKTKVYLLFSGRGVKRVGVKF